MHSVRFIAETSSHGVVERDFIVGAVPGVLWSPVSGSDHAPVVLMGHGGGLHKKTPALMARAHDAVITWGFTVVAIDAPGHGDRPRTAEDELARAEFRQAQAEGDTGRFESISVRYVTSTPLTTRLVTSPSITASCMTTPIRRARVKSHSRNSASVRSWSLKLAMPGSIHRRTDNRAVTAGRGCCSRAWRLPAETRRAGDLAP